MNTSPCVKLPARSQNEISLKTTARKLKDARNKIVILTDVRYWRRGTGAQQRIYVMVRYLMDCGFDVVTLLATTTADPTTDSTLASERRRIRELGLEVHSLFEDWQPEGWFARVIWELKCTVNWLRGGTRKRPPKPPSPRYLKGFELPVLTPRFQQMLRQINPDSVIVEYVTLAWLIDDSARSGKRQLLVDTHDLLSERNRQFREFGHEHWIRISPEEEAEALSQFDSVIAIQPHEAATFRQMVPDTIDVIVAGHPAESIPDKVDSDLAEFDFGYFGSDNASNVDAVEWFLREVWPSIVAMRPATTCLLAGTICDSLKPAETGQPGIQLQANVSNREALYKSFRVAINPVRFGTGLKIKNQEALAAGKPLVVSTHGAEGMTTSDGLEPWRVFSTANEMATQTLELIDKKSALQSAAADSLQYAREHLTPLVVYSDLVQKLSGDTASLPK